jgi:hypothetical protein
VSRCTSRGMQRALLGLTLVTVAGSCAESGRGPTAPSALQSSAPAMRAQTISWYCGGRTVSGGEDWTFPAAEGCATTRLFASTTGVAVGAVTVPPTNLRSTVSGSNVQLQWAMAPDGVVSFLVEAGSAPTLTNLATLNTGNAATILNVANVPNGSYHVRVRGVGADGIPGPPSNEIVVTVGTPPTGVPGAPTGLTRQVRGNQVTLTWSGVSTAASYIIEAGSRAGASDIVVFDTRSTTTTLTANAPNGLYFVRVRARNAVGTGGSSNEIAVGVNVAEPGAPPTPPPTPTPGPTPTPPSPPPTAPVQPVAPTAPPVEQIIPTLPVVTVPSGTAHVQVVRGGRPDAGAGPPVMVNIERPRPDAARARLTAARPFNRAAVTVDVPATTARNTRMVVAEAYYDIRLTEPQTTIEVTLTVPPNQSFALQVAVSDNNGNSFGSYVSASVSPIPPGADQGVTGTWTGIYRYGPECASYEGVETLSLSESNDGLFTGTLVDSTLGGVPVAQASLDGRRSGSDVTFTGRYTGSFQGVVSTFRGTFNGTVIDGTITGGCGQAGARVTFSRR